MDTSKDTTMEDSKGSACCGRGRHGWWFVRMVVVILFLMLVFGAGASFGRHKGLRYGYGSGGMMGYGYSRQDGGCGRGFGMRGGWDQGRLGSKATSGQSLNRVFGPITKIDGNKITVTDNGGKEQVVISQSSTTIVSVTGETGLKSLSVGQQITAIGTLDKDNALQAATIRIQ